VRHERRQTTEFRGREVIEAVQQNTADAFQRGGASLPAQQIGLPEESWNIVEARCLKPVLISGVGVGDNIVKGV
jgi:hypothetical protein